MRYDHDSEVGHLRKLGRVAIWNRERIVILIAIGVWLTDVAFLLVGEYPLPPPVIEVFLTSTVDITGAVRVNFSTLTILDLRG